MHTDLGEVVRAYNGLQEAQLKRLLVSRYQTRVRLIFVPSFSPDWKLEDPDHGDEVSIVLEGVAEIQTSSGLSLRQLSHPIGAGANSVAIVEFHTSGHWIERHTYLGPAARHLAIRWNASGIAGVPERSVDIVFLRGHARVVRADQPDQSLAPDGEAKGLQ